MISSVFPKFFEGNDYFIDEKVNLFKFENAYKVFDKEGLQIGNIVQKLTGGQKLLRLFFKKPMLPFLLEIKDMNGDVQASIKRGWTFFMSKIQVLDPQGNPIGLIRQRFKFFKPTFNIMDGGGNPVGTITGDWKAWNFTIKDSAENEIGTITKKWAGLAKELFTTADKYMVHIRPEYAEDMKKVAIVSAAITIDMVLKESK